jgi:hypothetical protein
MNYSSLPPSILWIAGCKGQDQRDEQERQRIRKLEQRIAKLEGKQQ